MLSPPLHPRVPRGRRQPGSLELVVVQHASSLIGELGAELDAMLQRETRAAEQLRLVRVATNRITRAANDAIQAYARGRRAVEVELGRDGRDASAALDMRSRLRAARLELLSALEAAKRRYTWSDSSRPPADASRRHP